MIRCHLTLFKVLETGVYIKASQNWVYDVTFYQLTILHEPRSSRKQTVKTKNRLFRFRDQARCRFVHSSATRMLGKPSPCSSAGGIRLYWICIGLAPVADVVYRCSAPYFTLQGELMRSNAEVIVRFIAPMVRGAVWIEFDVNSNDYSQCTMAPLF